VDWDDWEDDDDQEFRAMIAPFSRDFPGLAPAADQRLAAWEIAQALGSLRPARVGLAAAARPADVLPLIGWDGAVNRWENALPIAAVLRSWEERFGARLQRVGFAEIQLLADRPPRHPAGRATPGSRAVRVLQRMRRPGPARRLLDRQPPAPLAHLDLLVGLGEHRELHRAGNPAARQRQGRRASPRRSWPLRR
jgi:hypothetical protein